MTPAPHNPEQDLAQTLAHQADRFAERGGSPLELDQVLSRAGEIRRGRRMRASMVMAAVVLAVAVPVGISTLSENNATSPTPPPFATSSPNPSPIGLGEYASGGEPLNGFAEDGTLHHGTGMKSIGDGNVSALARMNGGYLLAQSDPTNGSTKVRFIADDGNGTDQTWAFDGQGIAVSAGTNVGAFVDNDGTVVAVQDAGTRYFEVGTLPAGASYQTVAVTGENCSGRSEEAGCTVWVTETDETATTWKVSPNTAPEKVAGLDHVIDVDGNGNLVRQVSYDDSKGATSAYVDADGNQRWQSSTYAPKAFSPDGRYVLAGPAYGDGLGDGELTVLNASDGTVVLNLDTEPVVQDLPTTVYEAVWEDDTHVLATVQQGAFYAVVRVALDGSREYALPKIRSNDEYGPAPIKLG